MLLLFPGGGDTKGAAPHSEVSHCAVVMACAVVLAVPNTQTFQRLRIK